MKLDVLRKVIREEVKAAIKEELQDMLTEAINVASTPVVNERVSPSKDVSYYAKTPTVPGTGNTVQGDTLTQLLAETKASMSQGDFKQVASGDSSIAQTYQRPNMASQMVNEMGLSPQVMTAQGPQPGLDLNQFDFMKKAKSINSAILEKDKEKGKI